MSSHRQHTFTCVSVQQSNHDTTFKLCASHNCQLRRQLLLREPRGFPVHHYTEDRLGLVLAFWGVGLHLGRPLVSQTDYQADGTIFGSVLNHVTDGRWATGTSMHIRH